VDWNGDIGMQTRTFRGVTAKMWDHFKAETRHRHGTQYDYTSDGNSGKATTRTPIGTIVVDFEYDPEAETVTYGIASKPFLIASGQIWNGLEQAMTELRQTEVREA
jgi:hypothetical protein